MSEDRMSISIRRDWVLPLTNLHPPEEPEIVERWLAWLRYQACTLFAMPCISLNMLDLGPERIWVRPAPILPYCAPLLALPERRFLKE